MAIDGYFFDAVNEGGVYDRVYSAEDVTNYLRQLVGNGVFPTPSNQLQVRAGSGMQIIVASGEGWINGHKIVNTSDLPLSIGTSDALLDRIDRVVFYADFVNRTMGIEVKQGTKATNPTAPALTRNTSRYEMGLATVRVNKQSTSVSGAMITDTRADSSVCGWVAGLIQQVDTSSLFVQWETAYNEYYTAVKQQLDDFMEALTQELRVNTYVVEFRKDVALDSSSSNTILFDWQDYTKEETDIVKVYINGLLAVPGTDYWFPRFVNGIELFLDTPAGVTNDVTVIVTKSVIGIEQSV